MSVRGSSCYIKNKKKQTNQTKIKRGVGRRKGIFVITDKNSSEKLQKGMARNILFKMKSIATIFFAFHV